MKINYCKRIIILIVFGVFSGALSYGQTVSKVFKNTPLKTVLKEVETQTGFSIIYEKNEINEEKPITKSFDKTPLKDVLSAIIEKPLSFSIENKMVSIFNPTTRNKNSSQSSPKKRLVSGVVFDEVDGSPLISATVHEKNNPTNASNTDLDGNFTLQVSDNNSTLVVKYLGYRDREAPVGDLAVIRIGMVPDDQSLKEVVVVGAGTQQKISITGAISTIEGASLKTPGTSLTKNLAGQIPGIIAMSGSGQPGSTSDFYIRGVATFGGRSTPLILLDEIEITADELNNIPTDDIASFTILKDASATAIYGAKGANGVMLVTTKTGRENTRTSVSIRTEMQLTSITKFPEFVDGPTWMTMYNDAQRYRYSGDGEVVVRYTPEVIENTRNNVNPYIYPNVKWEDYLFKDNALTEVVNVNVSGGGSRVTYFMGLTYTHDDGHINVPKFYSFDNNIDVNKFNFRNNIGYKMTPTTMVSLNMNTTVNRMIYPNSSNSVNSFFQDAYFTNPVAFAPVLPAEDGDTFIRFGNAYKEGNTLRENPYALLSSRYRERRVNNFSVSLKLKQDFDFILEGLKAHAMINFTSDSQTRFDRTITPHYFRVNEIDDKYENGFTQQPLNTNGTDYLSESGITRATSSGLSIQAQLFYNKKLEEHSMEGMLMYMQRESRSNILPSRNQGLSGRFLYDYNKRYFAEFNFGYNGTERLSKDNRFEFFPSISLGWVLSNEKFFEPLSQVITHLKFRGSYGLVGFDESGLEAGSLKFLHKNDVIMDYYTGPYFGDKGATTKRGPYVNFYAMPNPSWERALKLDLGIDFDLFHDFSVVFDFFTDKRSKILLHKKWPSSLGYADAVPWENMGRVKNQGFDLSVRYKANLAQDLTLDIKGNFSYSKNKFEEMDEPSYPYPWLQQTGHSISARKGYISDGFFKSQEEIDNSPTQSLGSTAMIGDIKYKDLNGDGTIDANDKSYFTGYGSIPRIQYGLGLALNYKNFDIGVFFEGSAQRTVMINDTRPFYGTGEYNVFKFYQDNYWTEENPNAKFPRLGLVYSEYANNHVDSDFWLRDASYIRFKTLSVGYSIKNKSILKQARIYFEGENLAVFSPFKYWDPMLQWNSYPLSRVFSLGLQLTF